MITLSALHTTVVGDEFSLSFSSITVPPVAIAISFSSSSFFSHTPGALIAHIFSNQCLFVRMNESNASPSTLFAITSMFFD